MLIALVWGSQGSLPGGHHRSFHQVWHQEAGRNGQGGHDSAEGNTSENLSERWRQVCGLFQMVGGHCTFLLLQFGTCPFPARRVLVCRGNWRNLLIWASLRSLHSESARMPNNAKIMHNIYMNCSYMGSSEHFEHHSVSWLFIVFSLELPYSHIFPMLIQNTIDPYWWLYIPSYHTSGWFYTSIYDHDIDSIDQDII